MNAEVFLNGGAVTDVDVQDQVVVVIDVLRACSTIITALDHGAKSVVPVADMAEAGKIAANLDHSTYVMGGERGGEKIDGYQLGNSPLEYTEDVVADKTVVLNTTNGTVAIKRVKAAHEVLIGSFLNVNAIADRLREQDRDVVLLCAGWENRVSFEDTLCAGMILELLGSDQGLIADTAHIARTLYRNDRGRIAESVKRSNHAQRLIHMGREADVDYALAIDSRPLVPIYRDSQIALLDVATTSS